MYVTDDTTASYYQTASNQKGYGGMAYYTSENCGSSGSSGCTTNYADSDIKYVVDAWKTANAPAATEARLITFEDLTENLDFEFQQVNITLQAYSYIENTPSWVYNSSYWYWTMSSHNDYSNVVWTVDRNGTLGTPTSVSLRASAPLVLSVLS